MFSSTTTAATTSAAAARACAAAAAQPETVRALYAVVPLVREMVRLRLLQPGMRDCVVCGAPFAIRRNQKTCSATCGSTLRNRTIAACQRGRYQRKSPLREQERTCRECGAVGAGDQFRHAEGTQCIECYRYGRHRRKAKATGSVPLDRSAWLEKDRRATAVKAGRCCYRCLGTEQLMANVRRDRKGNPSRTLYRCATCRREERRQIAERKGKRYIETREGWYEQQRHRRRMRLATLPERVSLTKLRREAMESWRDWLTRAPQWWLDQYEEAIRVVARDRQRCRYLDNPHYERERVKRYKQQHPEKKLRWQESRDAREDTLSDGTVTSSTKRAILTSRNDCPYCLHSLTPKGRSLDHLEPLALGGLHSIRNLTVCCRRCNFRKGKLSFLAWLDELSDEAAAVARQVYRQVTGKAGE